MDTGRGFPGVGSSARRSDTPKKPKRRSRTKTPIAYRLMDGGKGCHEGVWDTILLADGTRGLSSYRTLEYRISVRTETTVLNLDPITANRLAGGFGVGYVPKLVCSLNFIGVTIS